MSSQRKPKYTASEYLQLERNASERHEFAFGEIFAMGGASARHVEIVSNLVRELGNRLRDRACKVYATDLRLCVNAEGRYTYPDVLIVCGKPRFLDEQFDTLLNPDVIIEVMSNSTRNYDRGDKFQQYREIPSFREYLLVDQSCVYIEKHTKGDDGDWKLTEIKSLEAEIHLDSINIVLPVAEIYLKVDFASIEETTRPSS